MSLRTRVAVLTCRAALVAAAMLAGCVHGPRMVPAAQQKPVDRTAVVYPSNTQLFVMVDGLTAPTAIAWDNEKSLLIAEGGIGGHGASIFGFKRDGTFFEVWPKGRQLPQFLRSDKFELKGPIGGMIAAHGKIYVTHRDASDLGVITAFDYNGGHTTIVGGLPAQGDYSVTDIALGPTGRLYFGLGAATNSGVVGIDNMPWLRKHQDFCDRYCPPGVPAERHELFLLGRRFDTPNPFAGLFGGTDLAVTGPYQPFGRSIQTRIAPSNGLANAAIYSIDPSGGEARIEAHGIRYPMGLGFNEFGTLYVTNQGMKLRGTRPVLKDPDVLLRTVLPAWYGWPDYSANLLPIREAQFQPPVAMIVKTGYPDLSFLIDHGLSKLTPPDANTRERLLAGEFSPLAGAAKFDFAPASGPFKKLHDNGSVIVALFGDRAPFDTGGQAVHPTGYKVVQVPLDGQVSEFMYNSVEGPASAHGEEAVGLERPIDAKFGPDGALYILDFGQMKMRNGQEQVSGGTGRIFRLVGTGDTAAPK